MPPISAVLGTWVLDPVAALVVVVAVAAYLLGVRRVTAAGRPWAASRTWAFLILGVGSYAVISFGFLGADSRTLRYAFTTRVALLLLLAPGLATIGRPATLLRAATTGCTHRAVVKALDSRIFQLLGNAIVAPLIPMAIFFVLATPIAGWLRVSLLGEGLVSVLAPIVGLILGVALTEESRQRTSAAITGEFLIAFVELVVDALPGIVMRLATSVLDGAPMVAGAVLPHWYPAPLRDQQLAGDLLWFIAEAGDLPALILLILRWSRTDRSEAKSFDDLTDEEYAAIAAAHLQGPNRPAPPSEPPSRPLSG